MGRPNTQEERAGWVAIRAVALVSLTIVLSVSLINFNKYLMQAGRFPYAAVLVLLHMGFCSVLAFILRRAAPGLFPSLTDPDKRVEVDSKFMLRGALPIGVTFTVSLVCANLAYAHLSVAFLQMLKETNIVLVYVFSLLAAVEVFSWRQVQVIMFAVFAASLTIRGEMHFSWKGFLIQMTSQLCECLRIVMQSVLLSGQKLDPMSYVLIVSPICFVLLGGFLGVLMLLPAGVAVGSLALPSSTVLWQYAPLLLGSCCIAFALNVCIAVLIKYTSAVSYIFCGVLKDIVAVLVGMVVLKESVSGLQRLSFVLQISAVVMWSMLKTYPALFRDKGLVGGLAALVLHGGKQAASDELATEKGVAQDDDEQKPLLNKAVP